MCRLGRDINRCVLVDDTPLAFYRQPDHGIPVLQVGHVGPAGLGWVALGEAATARPWHPDATGGESGWVLGGNGLDATGWRCLHATLVAVAPSLSFHAPHPHSCSTAAIRTTACCLRRWPLC